MGTFKRLLHKIFLLLSIDLTCTAIAHADSQSATNKA